MAVATLAIALVSLGLLGFAASRAGARASAAIGVGLGVAAAATLGVVMLYSFRRALPAVRRLGPTRGYLEVHLWGGALFLWLVVLHAGLGPPAGALNVVLWAASLWVVTTGAVGVVLQRALPRVLEPGSSFEVHLRRIPELVAELRTRAEQAALRGDPRVRAFYDRTLATEMERPRMIASALVPVGGSADRTGTEVALLRRTLTDEGAVTLDELQALAGAKRDLDVHFTVQRILRGWLYSHLPVAIVLIVLVALHVFFVLYF